VPRRRAAAYFVREIVLPNDLLLQRPALLGPAGGGVLSGDEGVDPGFYAWRACPIGERDWSTPTAHTGPLWRLPRFILRLLGFAVVVLGIGAA
jgi:hypothetical protein